MKKEANMQKRRWKITALISKKAINMADFALISEHLSPLKIRKRLTSKLLKTGGDSDRCFATFYITTNQSSPT